MNLLVETALTHHTARPAAFQQLFARYQLARLAQQAFQYTAAGKAKIDNVFLIVLHQRELIAAWEKARSTVGPTSFENKAGCFSVEFTVRGRCHWQIPLNSMLAAVRWSATGSIALAKAAAQSGP